MVKLPYIYTYIHTTVYIYIICFKPSPHMRSQICRLHVSICIGGCICRFVLEAIAVGRSREDCREISLVAYMFRFVLEAIAVGEVLRGLSRDFLSPVCVDCGLAKSS